MGNGANDLKKMVHVKSVCTYTGTYLRTKQPLFLMRCTQVFPNLALTLIGVHLSETKEKIE